MHILFNTDRRRWEAKTEYVERDIPKAAGWRWDPVFRLWFAPSLEAAAKLGPKFPAPALEQLHLQIDAANAAAKLADAASRATDAEIDIPAPAGMAYLPFQRAGIARLIDLPRALLADEQGLGKTVQIVGLANLAALRGESMTRVLVVCPAFLRVNWSREIGRWQTLGLPVTVWDGKRELPATGWVVLGYETATKHAETLAAVAWDLVAFDEAHALKNPKAARTKAALAAKTGYAHRARRLVFATGTPILNRPIELWPLVSFTGAFTNWKDFAVRYCDGRQTRFGWNVTGASNTENLQAKLRRSVMVRRLKKDVLTELPAKQRSLVVLEATSRAAKQALAAEKTAAADLRKREAELRAQAEAAEKAKDETAFKNAVAALRKARLAAFTEMSKIRHDIGLAKVEAAIEHVRELLETEGAVIVFAHHKDVAEAVHNAFSDVSVLAHGDVPADERQAAVDQIQRGEKRLFVGTIAAASTGLTITRAQRVVFVEQDWTPGRMAQAEDRAHRIGQTGNVQVQYLVLDGSLDADIAERLVHKADVAEAALDRFVEQAEIEKPVAERNEEDEALMQPVGRAVSNENKRDRADYPSPYGELPQIEPLPAGRVALLRRMMVSLAERDDDRASERNGVGFNKRDSDFGNMLAHLADDGVNWSTWQEHQALKLATRYHRQLVGTFGETVVDEALGREKRAA